MNALVVIIAIIAVLALAIIGIYNSLVTKRNQVANMRAGVDTQLKKRYDLIPNLVAAVREYMTHEQGVLERITALRAQAMAGDGDFALQSELTRLLGNIRVAMENYPALRANENVMHLQRSLNEVEAQISASRRAYNSGVMSYNNATQMFPSNLVAGIFGFKEAEFFEADEGERDAPNVKELFK